jgi:hypothetical protein
VLGPPGPRLGRRVAQLLPGRAALAGDLLIRAVIFSGVSCLTTCRSNDLVEMSASRHRFRISSGTSVRDKGPCATASVSGATPPRPLNPTRRHRTHRVFRRATLALRSSRRMLVERPRSPRRGAGARETERQIEFFAVEPHAHTASGGP